KYLEPPGAISSSHYHELIATNGSPIRALQLPESRFEVFWRFLVQSQKRSSSFFY
ncbi:hypothetical protein LINPERHAP1_LOCUS8014, partial [Linum perenne]